MLDIGGGDHRVAFRLRLQRRQDGGRVGLGARENLKMISESCSAPSNACT